MSVKHIKKMYRILVFLDAGGVLSPFRHRRKTHLPPGQGLSLLLYPRQRPQSSLLGLLELLLVVAARNADDAYVDSKEKDRAAAAEEEVYIAGDRQEFLTSHTRTE
ncbi:hypothetical protein C5167_009871 [Papaver somniferum]|uniref:Uncharacterized protein n=1 Tax=Papaver somniferum TaxID=3469 RepID=A0A4Y7JYL2_PAPSO|nr:hypothetical protein C5167_009871 [Papaver somniferum]